MASSHEDVVRFWPDGTPFRAPGAEAGVRELKKADKWRRISSTARRLFAERGYESVTTAELARESGVGVGTLFRYVRSKAALLVTILNEQVQIGVEMALDQAAEGGSAEDCIMTMLRPLADQCREHPENATAYEREVLFGEGSQRSQAVHQLTGLEDVIVEILLRTGELPAADATSSTAWETPDQDAETELGEMAHAIAATVHLDIVRAGLGRDPVAELPGRVRDSVRFLLRRL